MAYHFLEGWSFLDSLYFSVVTLATVGFGDLTPTTALAKLFTVGYITVGIGIVAAFASELTKFRRAERLAARRSGRARGIGDRAGPAIRDRSDATDPAGGPAGDADRRGRGPPGAQPARTPSPARGLSTSAKLPRCWPRATSPSRSGSPRTHASGCGAT